MSMTDRRSHDVDPMAHRRRIVALQLAGLLALLIFAGFLVFEAMQVG